MDRPIVREGENVSLGVLQRSDIPQMYLEFNTPEAQRFLPGRERVVSLEQAYALYDRAHLDDSTVSYAIAVNSLRGKASSDLAGEITLGHIDRVHRRAEVGYALFGKFWGKGYGTEALSLAVKHAFGVFNLRKLTAVVYGPNIASVKMLEKNGFRKAVTFSKHVFVEGKGYVDELIYELLRKE